ncbi:PqqD family protein [Clostridium sp. JN-9]|uniref:PqqD family protein n=1 Tax=Clostridium sp. JN-9 TaxID=2507159 RepID=UPI001FAB1576|nr:PqqD family protein [Clostridium sp. JN-9]
MKENGDLMKKKHKNEDNFLLYVPVKKHTDWEVRSGKVYLLFYHNKPIEKFMRWLVKKPYVSDVELDDIGSYVWKSIDGKISVYEIGERLLKEFGKKCDPVYDRLIMYLRYLNRKGWVYFDRGNQKSSK